MRSTIKITMLIFTMVGLLIYWVLSILHFQTILSFKIFYFNKIANLCPSIFIFIFCKKQAYSHYNLFPLVENNIREKNVSLFKSFKDTISCFIKPLFQKLHRSNTTIIRGGKRLLPEPDIVKWSNTRSGLSIFP